MQHLPAAISQGGNEWPLRPTIWAGVMTVTVCPLHSLGMHRSCLPRPLYGGILCNICNTCLNCMCTTLVLLSLSLPCLKLVGALFMLRAAIGVLKCIPLHHHARAFSGAAKHSAVTHYDVLGVRQTASAEEIKHAFRKKAKDLHPDLNAEFTSADGEAFLRLVTAYEVLSDPQQRQLYDLTNSPRLPGVLKRAAESAAGGGGGAVGAADHGSGAAEDSQADPFGWRYGLSEWARYGPAADSPALNSSDGSIGGLRGPVLAALARHRRELEADLHAGLLKAYLGPKLDVAPGELPAAFEADERAHPSLSHDLLHLVHGRTLLGVVRIQQPLQIAGGAGSVAASLPASDEHALQGTPALPGPQDVDTAAVPPDNSTHLQMQPATDQWQQGSRQQVAGCTLQDSVRGQGHKMEHYQLAATGSKAAAGSAAAGLHCASDDDVISEAQWQELLQLQHPLRGLYIWAPPPALRLTAVGAVAAVADGLSSSEATVSSSEWSRSSSSEHAQVGPDCTLGGRQAQEAWQGMWQQTYGVQADAVEAQQQPASAAAAGGAGGEGEQLSVAGAGGASDAAPQGSNSSSNRGASCSVSKPTVHAETVHAVEGIPAGQPGQQQQEQQQLMCKEQEKEGLRTAEIGGQYIGQQWQQQQQHRNVYRQAQQEQHQEHGHEQFNQGAQSQQEEQQQWRRQQQQPNARDQQQSNWLKQRRLWRWLRSPTADWTAADWSFDDSSNGVLVMQLLLDPSQVTAVAVRDDSQPAKPIKVYINNRFTAAVLDDIVMEPLTGRLKAVLYRYYTPGVHHLYFYLPNKQGSRVLARLQRRWMPPSSTWLFPPMAESHDVGGWVVEWEGHNCQHKTGWMHPAVYLLVAASYSRDMELRKAAGTRTLVQQQLWQLASHSGTRLGQVVQWLQDKWASVRGVN